MPASASCRGRHTVVATSHSFCQQDADRTADRMSALLPERISDEQGHEQPEQAFDEKKDKPGNAEAFEPFNQLKLA